MKEEEEKEEGRRGEVFFNLERERSEARRKRKEEEERCFLFFFLLSYLGERWRCFGFWFQEFPVAYYSLADTRRRSVQFSLVHCFLSCSLLRSLRSLLFFPLCRYLEDCWRVRVRRSVATTVSEPMSDRRRSLEDAQAKSCPNEH